MTMPGSFQLLCVIPGSTVARVEMRIDRPDEDKADALECCHLHHVRIQPADIRSGPCRQAD
jgi:hypothetical protein